MFRDKNLAFVFEPTLIQTGCLTDVSGFSSRGGGSATYYRY